MECAVVVDEDVGIGEVFLREVADGFGNGVVLVDAWAGVVGLYEGVYLAVHKLAFVVQSHGDDGRIAADAGDADACGGAEVAEAVGDEVAFIDLHGAADMRAVSIDEVGTVVDAEVREGAQVAAVFAEELLGALGQVYLILAFGTAVEGDDEDVAGVAQVAQDGAHLGSVLMAVGVAVVAEGTKAISDVAALDEGRAAEFFHAGIADADGIEDRHGFLDPFGAEVLAVVVGKSQIDEKREDYTFNDFYFRMYYQLLHHKMDMDYTYNIYMDIKDTCSSDKLERLRKIMEYNSSIGRFQFIRSHESVFIQLADVLMGAINYNLRYEKGEVEGRVRAKMKLIEKIKKHSNISLNTTTPKFRKKFNLFFIALK